NKPKPDDDIPEFDRHNVQLDIPPQLFSNSFSTVTKVSDLISKLIMNSSRRYAKFALFFKPLFGDALTVEGYQDPTTTTSTT
uniref:Uncharacterized protein n=1 Tax=Megaselia scalaris TaxID=36166 RepID=T1H6I3_MEGSC